MRRLRQVAFATTDRDRLVEDLREVLGLGQGYEDAAIGQLGLHNAVLPVGDQFVEVVAPVTDGTTAERYVHRRGGDTGYMLIFQTDDHPAHVAAVEQLGVRVVARFDAPGFTDVQLHPADTGGAFIEIDQNDPPDDWHPAGRDWRGEVRTDVVSSIVAAEVACNDPAAVADRWSQLLLAPLADGEGGPDLGLVGSIVRFRPIADDRGEGIAGIDVAARDPDAVIERAVARRITVEPGAVLLGGLRIRPVAST